MLHLTLPEFLISHPDIWPITVFFLSRVWSLQFCHEAHFLLYEKYSIAIIGYKISTVFPPCNVSLHYMVTFFATQVLAA